MKIFNYSTTIPIISLLIAKKLIEKNRPSKKAVERADKLITQNII